MALELILQEAQGLSEESLMEVLRFMRFIKAESTNVSASDAAQGDSPKRRKAGQYQGQILMSDDFDAPMSEFKEYM